jgi:hypothetical protein
MLNFLCNFWIASMDEDISSNGVRQIPMLFIFWTIKPIRPLGSSVSTFYSFYYEFNEKTGKFLFRRDIYICILSSFFKKMYFLSYFGFHIHGFKTHL